MSAPPTPGEFARELARLHVPADPDNPFNDRQTPAAKRLALQAVTELYGKEHPMARICTGQSRLERMLFPANWATNQKERIEDVLNDMRDAWGELEDLIINEIEQAP